MIKLKRQDYKSLGNHFPKFSSNPFEEQNFAGTAEIGKAQDNRKVLHYHFNNSTQCFPLKAKEMRKRKSKLKLQKACWRGKLPFL